MSEQEIFHVLVEQVRRVLPAVPRDRVSLTGTLRELGADSIDRADIVTMTAEAVGANIPLVELGKTPTIGALVALLHEHISAAAPGRTLAP